VELLSFVESIDWDCDHTSDFETCSTTLTNDCISESDCEADVVESDDGAEPESNCAWSDDSEEFESDDEATFPARCMCISDLGAMLEEKFPDRTLCVELLPLVGNIDWDCRNDSSDDTEEQSNDAMVFDKW
jgi:hypothetical protein